MAANQIKTLHMTNAYHPSSGGVATAYRALLREADRKGRMMRLVVPSDRDSVEEVGGSGLIYHIRAPHSKLFDRRYRAILPHRYLTTRRSRIWEILAAEQPDLLEVRDKFCLNWLGGLFRKGWHSGVKRPVLVGSSCERLDDTLAAYVMPGKLTALLARLYMSYCYTPLFDFHVANSSYTAEEIYRARLSKHARPVVVFSEGVDCETFAPSRRDSGVRNNLLREVGGGEGSLLLLYSGRVSPEKNVHLLSDVMAMLQAGSEADYRLVIAGDGPLAESLKRRLTAVASGRFAFMGHVADREDLARLYASCDLFVHPNPREPFGIAPLEAMASGLALVAPHSGGITSYADESCAWLVPPDTDSFVRAINGAADPELRRKKAAAARQVAQEYDWPIVAARLFGWFDRLVELQSQSAAGSHSPLSYLYG
jgi:alpha-1,6-mannosyltransferase